MISKNNKKHLRSIKCDYEEIESMIKNGDLCKRNGDIHFAKLNNEYKKRYLKIISVANQSRESLERFFISQGVDPNSYYSPRRDPDSLIIRVVKKRDAVCY